LLIAFLAISFSFVLFRVLPGDVVTNMSRVPNMTKEAQAALRAQFGIDRPLVAQYGLYLKELARGNLGVSYQSQQPVLDDVLEAVGNTVPMVGIGTVRRDADRRHGRLPAGQRPRSHHHGRCHGRLLPAGAVGRLTAPRVALGVASDLGHERPLSDRKSVV